MKKFEFSLEKLRRYRQSRLDEQQARLLALMAERVELERRRAALEEEDIASAERVRAARLITVEELSAVDGFRRFAARERVRLMSAAGELASRIDAQRARVVEARRQVESLEKLKGQRLDAWRKDLDRETESVVAELVVARWRENPA